MGMTARTILLVEDEAIIAMGEASQLKKAGYAVILAPSGEKAIEIVCADPAAVDLILMDIDLGKGMDGAEAAQRILRSHNIPILFLSSHMEPDIVHKTEEITNYGYVVKSSSFTVLDASIKMAFKLFAAARQLDLNGMEIESANEELRASLENLQRTNRDLALSEDKFSKAFHLNPDSININRLSDGVYVDINEGFTRIMGYTREDSIGRSSLPGDLGIWVDPEDRERLVQGLREKGEVSNLEAEFRKKDGTTTIGLMSARVIEIDGEKCIISITRDMGGWRVLEENYRDTEMKFRSAFEASPMGISLTALDGQLRTVNHAFCAMLGRSMTEVNAMDFTALTHPDDLELSARMTRRLIEGEADRCHFRKRFIHKDGHTVWAEMSVALVKDKSGMPDYFVAQASDVSEQVALDDRLRRTELLLRTSMESPKDIFIVALDRGYRCLFVNKTYRERKLANFGIEVEVGKCLLDNLPRDDFFRRSMPNYERAFAGESVRVVEEYESPYTVSETLYSPISSEDGEIIGATAFGTDITERKFMENALKESERRYSTLLDAVGEGFCLLDESEVFRMTNPAAERIFAVAPGSLVGRPLFDFLDEEGRECSRRETENLKRGESTEFVTPLVRDDGQRIFLRINASPLSEGGARYTGASVVMRDITEELKANVELNSLVKKKETLMKELEHRVKNNLNLVSSLLGIAMGEIEDGKARGILEDTESRIRSMSAIYERLYLSENVDTLDFGTYVDGLARSIFSAFSRDSTPVELVIEASHIEIDTKRAISLGLILNELLTNAIKYAFPDKRRGIIKVAFDRAGDKVFLRISDDGIGLPALGIPENATSMGMTLIRLLTGQIGAAMEVESEGGTAISVVFKP